MAMLRLWMVGLMIQYQDFIQWLFYGVVGGSAIYGVQILGKMKESIDSLNINVATLLERSASHEKRIERLEEKS